MEHGDGSERPTESGLLGDRDTGQLDRQGDWVFRQLLLDEVRQWRNEGLISPQQYQVLCDRYRVEGVEVYARHRYLTVLLGVGFLLVGLGALFFVAAQWDGWPRSLQLGLCVLAMVLSGGTGSFLWWRSGRGIAEAKPFSIPGFPWIARQISTQQRLANGLLILAALLWGATLQLWAGPDAGANSSVLYWLWSLGVWVGAIALRSQALAVISFGLGTIAYLQIGDGDIFNSSQSTFGAFVLDYGPAIALAMGIPATWRCRSQALWILTLVAELAALWVALDRWSLPFGLAAPIALLLPFLMFWSYQDSVVIALAKRVGKGRSLPWLRGLGFETLARLMVLLILSSFLYLFSFRSIWDSLILASYPDFAGVTPLQWLELIGLGAIASLGWGAQLQTFRRRRQQHKPWSSTEKIAIAVAVFYGISALLLGLQGSGMALTPVSVFTTNALLFLFSVGCLREGLSHNSRNGFWCGVLLLGLQIISRVLEYDTSLLLKAAVSGGCGVGVIAAGLWFERLLPTLASETDE